MECRDVREYLLMADRTVDHPPEVETHLSTCPECRQASVRLEAALVSLVSGLDGTAPAVSTERIMRAIRREADNADQPTSLRNWVIVGTLLVGGLFGLRFSEVMEWLRSTAGPGIEVAMSLILGIFLTAYICLLVASNLRRVQRVFRLRLRQ